MKTKRILTLLLAVFAAVFLFGCKQNVGTPEDNAVVEEPEAGEEESEAENRLFGFACPDLSNPFYEVLKDSISTALEEQGDRIMVRDAQMDSAVQNEQVQELIDAGAEAVFLCPVDPEEVTPGLELLKEADIPVINLDIRVNVSELTDAFIGSDDYNAGRVCGEDLTAKFPDGGRVVIVESPKVGSVNERITGFEEAVRNAAFEVVSRIDIMQDNQNVSGELERILSDESIDAVMCGDDNMALQVLDTLETAGRSDILVYTVGGSPAVKNALADPASPMEGIGAQSPINIGKTAVKTAAAILENGVYESEINVETFFINQDNVDMYGTDGWQ